MKRDLETRPGYLEISESASRLRESSPLPNQVNALVYFLMAFNQAVYAAGRMLGIENTKALLADPMQLTLIAPVGTFRPKFRQLAWVVSPWMTEESRQAWNDVIEVAVTNFDFRLIQSMFGMHFSSSFWRLNDFLNDVGQLIDPSLRTTSCESVIERWPQIAAQIAATFGSEQV
jgi:hypothetical protein